MKKNAKVMFVDDERSEGNSLIVTLNRGWRFDYTDVVHVMGFDTVKDANSAIKSARKCDCRDCGGRE